MILDTDFLIALRNGHDGAVELATELEQSGVPRRIPSVVIQELYVGVGASDEATDAARIYEALIENESIVSLDENIARLAGSLEGTHLASDDKPDLGPADAIVAATGLVHNEAVVTTDQDFQAVDGLTVEEF
jgi:tRNA(fMet)-specific endonuclease VapC